MLEIHALGFAYRFADEMQILDFLDHHADEVCEIKSVNEKETTAKMELARAERDVVTKHMIELEQELSRVTKKLSAAETAIRQIAAGGKTWMCPYCGHCTDTTSGIAACELAGQCSMPYTNFVLRGE